MTTNEANIITLRNRFESLLTRTAQTQSPITGAALKGMGLALTKLLLAQIEATPSAAPGADAIVAGLGAETDFIAVAMDMATKGKTLTEVSLQVAPYLDRMAAGRAAEQLAA